VNEKPDGRKKFIEDFDESIGLDEEIIPERDDIVIDKEILKRTDIKDQI
jgi:hypothetical protein